MLVPSIDSDQNARKVLGLIVQLREKTQNIILNGSPLSDVYLDKDENYNIISILGGRGSGKTTLLSEVLTSLTNGNNDIVLPPVYPELFSEDDNIISRIFSEMAKLLKELERDFDNDSWAIGTSSGEGLQSQRNELHELGKLHSRISRTVASTLSRYRESLVQNAADRYDYSSQLSRLSDESVSLHNLINIFLSNLAKYYSQYKGKKSLRFFIFIDDIDMRPDLAPQLFDQVRVFLASPYIFVIKAGHLESLVYAFQTYYAGKMQLQAHEAGKNVFIQNLVSKRLKKCMPQNLRVSISSPSPLQKVLFKPLGRDKTLLEILKNVPLTKEWGDPSRRRSSFSSLGDYFDLAWLEEATDSTYIVPSSYCAALPDTYRDLSQLYLALESVLTEKEEDEFSQVILNESFYTLWKVCVESVSVQWLESVTGRLVKQETSDGITFEANFNNLFTGVQKHSPTYTFLADDYAMGISAYERTLIHRKNGEEETEFPKGLAEAMLLLDDICQSELTVITGQYGSLNLNSDEAGAGITVHYNKNKAVSLYLPIPDWQSYLDLQCWGRLWKSVRLLMKGLPTDEKSEKLKESGLEWAYIQTFRMSFDVFMRSQSSIPIVDEVLFVDLLDDWDINREQEFRSLRGYAIASAQGFGLDRTNRDKLFIDWLQKKMLLYAIPFFKDSWLSDSIFELWEEILQILYPNDDLRQVAIRAVFDSLNRFANNNSGQPWASKMVNVLERISNSSDEINDAGERIEGLRLRIQKMRESPYPEDLLNAISILQSQGIDKGLLDSFLENGPTSSVVTGLMRSGLSSRIVNQLSNMYYSQNEPANLASNGVVE